MCLTSNTKEYNLRATFLSPCLLNFMPYNAVE